MEFGFLISSGPLVEIRRDLYRRILWVLPYRARVCLDYIRRERRFPRIHAPKLHSERLLKRILDETDTLFTQICSKVWVKMNVAEKMAPSDLRMARTYWFGSAEDIAQGVSVASKSGRPWVLKPNNLGGGLILRPNGDWSQGRLTKEVDAFLREAEKVQRIYEKSAPVAWRNSEAGFLIEERIGSGDIDDVKVHVFSGIPRVVSIYTDRTNALAVSHFSVDGKLLFSRNSGRAVKVLDPIVRERVLEAASELSLGLRYTRVDFYCVDGELWFGELSPFGSMDGLRGNRRVDELMGRWWTGAEEEG